MHCNVNPIKAKEKWNFPFTVTVQRPPYPHKMQALRLRKQHPEISEADLMGLINDFQSRSEDDQYLSKPEVSKALTGRQFGYDEVREVLKTTSDASGRVDLEEFVELFSKLQTSAASTPAAANKAGKLKLGGSTAGSSHTVNADERTEFTRHINTVLAGDADVGSRIPIPTDTMQLFDECRGALLLDSASTQINMCTALLTFACPFAFVHLFPLSQMQQTVLCSRSLSTTLSLTPSMSVSSTSLAALLRAVPLTEEPPQPRASLLQPFRKVSTTSK